jgi:O-antigen ligase
VLRLRGAGMFRDPNDFCVLVAIAVPLALSHLLDRTRGGLRVLWLVPLAVLVDAVLLTQSRGGFLAMLVGIAVVMAMRFGRVVGIALMLLVPGMLLALGGGRQTSFSTGSGTAQERVQVWSDALVRLRGNPVFGVGVHEFLKESRLVVHNTYLHAYAETGLIGGTIFIGACFLTARHFYRRRNLAIVRNPEMRRLVPYLAGTCGCFCMGMMSLSLTYLTLTVMIFAIGDVTGRLATTDPEIPEDRADLRLGGQLVGASIAFLIFMNVFVRVAMVRG